jgi:hypothetical protein
LRGQRKPSHKRLEMKNHESGLQVEPLLLSLFSFQFVGKPLQKN